MSPMAAKSTREAIISQIILGISVVGCLFYFQTLMCRHSRSLSAAVNVFWGGTLSGSLHALSGPDHLAALLPFVLGKQWHKGAYFGSIWGLGHGLTTSVLGILGFYVKDSLLAYKLLPQLTSLADYAVGVTLIIIGIMGIHESRSIPKENAVTTLGEVENNGQSLNAAEVEKIQPSESSSVIITIFANGCFLGMSWDGLPSLAPTLALFSWQSLFAFLAAYCVGTVLTISVASGCIGMSTKWLSTVISDDLPRRLALVRYHIASHTSITYSRFLLQINFLTHTCRIPCPHSVCPHIVYTHHIPLFFSSICAIVIGVVWILQSLLKLIEVNQQSD